MLLEARLLGRCGGEMGSIISPGGEKLCASVGRARGRGVGQPGLRARLEAGRVIETRHLTSHFSAPHESTGTTTQLQARSPIWSRRVACARCARCAALVGRLLSLPTGRRAPAPVTVPVRAPAPVPVPAPVRAPAPVPARYRHRYGHRHRYWWHRDRYRWYRHRYRCRCSGTAAPPHAR